MVVLADEVLESFFETDLSASFRLEPVPEMELPQSHSGLLGDIWSNIATTDNKKIFNKFTDEIGKTIGKHQVCILLLINLYLWPYGVRFVPIGYSSSLNWSLHQSRRAQSSRVPSNARHATFIF